MATTLNGDCTIAAVAHADTVYHGLISKKHIMTEKAVEKVYFHLSGGIDSGLVELDVLNYWRQHGIGGNKIIAYVSIDRKNQTNIKQAIHLFGGVYLGFHVQQNCESDFDAGKPWTPGRLTKHAHAVYAVGYDSQQLTVLTWGNTQKATWEWWDECVDEAYAILPSEAKDSDFAGVDLAELKKDLGDIAS
jgi:hypothetical protein